MIDVQPPAPARQVPVALLLIVGGMFLALAAAVWLALFSAPPAAVATAAAPAAAKAEADRAVAAAGLDPRQRAAMEAVVRDYMARHPEIVAEAIDALNARAVAERIAPFRARAERPFPGAVMGNPEGSITLVEFTDYACGYCRASASDVKRLLAADKRVRLVVRELPILTDASRDAALMALAAADQGRYAAFHSAMFAAGKPDAKTIDTAARAAGLDLVRARAFAASPAASAELQNNLELARALQFGGTPSFVIGSRLLEGAVGYDRLVEAVGQASATP